MRRNDEGGLESACERIGFQGQAQDGAEHVPAGERDAGGRTADLGAADATPIVNRNLGADQAMLDRAYRHFDIPAEAMVTQLQLAQSLEPDRAKRPEIVNRLAPYQSYQPAYSAVSDALRKRHRAAFAPGAHANPDREIGAVYDRVEQGRHFFEAQRRVRVAARLL